MSVCLSVCALAYLRNNTSNFTKFFERDTCAVARSSSDDSAIRATRVSPFITRHRPSTEHSLTFSVHAMLSKPVHCKSAQ